MWANRALLSTSTIVMVSDSMKMRRLRQFRSKCRSFPISSGFNYPEKSSKHTAGAEAVDAGEKDKLIAVAVEQSVGAASTADEAKTTTSVSSASRVKVTLCGKMICSRSPAVTRDQCEQNWEADVKW